MALHITKGLDSPITLGIIPSEIGQHFVDTVNGDTYESVGTNSSGDWKQTNNGGAVATSFLDLDDTPGVYGVGSAGQVATVNIGENGLEFLDPTGLVESVHGRIGDVVSVSGDYDADEIDETGTRVFLTPSEKSQIATNSTDISNKPDTFLELDDTPISYPSGSAGFGLKVNDAEDGLEFTNGPTAAAGMALSTSNLIGCEISINADDTLFDMAAGTGIHVSHTTPGDPAITIVNVPERLGVAVDNIGTQPSTAISIDISGNIVQAADSNTPTQRRDRFSVGVLIHTNLTSIVDIAIAWSPGYDGHAQLNDLFDAIGFFLTGGNDISGVTSTLSIQKAAGTGFARGINVDVNTKDPHTATLPEQNPITFFNLKQDGVVFGVDTFLDPTTYDNAGVLTTIPGSNNQATIKYLFLFATGAMSVLTGQEIFASFSAAVDASGSETVIFPPILGSGIFMARIIMTKGSSDTTDSSNVRIVPTAAVASGGGGGSSTTMQGSYDISVQPQVTLDAGSGGIEYRDASTPIGASLLKVADNAGTTDFFNVEDDKVTVIDLVSDGLTASRALASDGSKKVVASATTSTELGFVAGVTSSVQDQIDDKQDEITAGTTSQYYRGDKVFQELNKAAVGLANVDNTTDALKPISTATQSALDDKEDDITATTTADYFQGDKTFQPKLGLPISTATQSALDGKEDEITATTSADIYQGDKTFVPKLGLPISTATQSALDAKPDNFLELPDTPANYLLGPSRFVAVNAAGDALEFVGGNLWTPTDLLVEPISWVDASDTTTITASGGNVSLLADKTSNGNDLSQGTGSRQPETGSTLNSLNVITFDHTTAEVLVHNTFPIPTSKDISIFAVQSYTGGEGTVSDALFSMDSATADWQVTSDNVAQFDGRVNSSGMGGSSIQNWTGGPFNGPSIYNAYFNKTGNGRGAYVDGVEVTTEDVYTTGMDAIQQFRIMANRSNTGSISGILAECIIVEDQSLETRQLIEGYLKFKWNLPALPSGHPYEFGPPTIGTGGSFDSLTDTPVNKSGFGEVYAPIVNAAENALEYKKVKPALTSNVTLEVDFSGGGDYTNLQEAWDYITQFESDGKSVTINITNIASLTDLQDLRLSQTGGDWGHIALQWPGTQVVPVGLAAITSNILQFTNCHAPDLDSVSSMDLDLSNKYRAFCFWSGASGVIGASNSDGQRFRLRNPTNTTNLSNNSNACFRIERFASVRAGNTELLGAVNIGYRVSDGGAVSCNNARIQANRFGISASASVVVGTGSVDFSVGGTFFPTSNEDVDIANGSTIILSTATFTGTRPKTNLSDTINIPVPDGVLYTNSEDTLDDIIPVESSASGSMDGDFTSGNWAVERVGNIVTMTLPSATHTSGSSASTTAVIPVGFRPLTTSNSLYTMGDTDVRNVGVSTGGVITTTYRDWAGVLFARTSSGTGTISYIVA